MTPARQVSRRRLLGLAGLTGLAGLAGAGSITGCTSRSPLWRETAAMAPEPQPTSQPQPMTSERAWARLAVGNARFAAGKSIHPHQGVTWREGVVDGQHPFACVLGCIDSRVPPELVFDAGLGDIISVRSAGQVLDDAVVGSVEYAVAVLGVPLVLVLGHSRCGAVEATVGAVYDEQPVRGGLGPVVRDIEAAVRKTPYVEDRVALVSACVAEQADRVGRLLVERSGVLAEATTRDSDPVRVLSATYDLESGLVTQVRLESSPTKQPVPGARPADR